MQSHSKFLLGDLLLREGLLTQEHVTHACEVQRTLTSPLPYGEVCLRLGFLSPDELAAILKKHHHRIPLGELLVHHGLVSATHVQTALARQRGSTKKLGALLVENGWLSERDLLQTLQKQTLLAKKVRGKFDALIYAGRITHEGVEAATLEARNERQPVEAVLLTKYGPEQTGNWLCPEHLLPVPLCRIRKRSEHRCRVSASHLPQLSHDQCLGPVACHARVG